MSDVTLYVLVTPSVAGRLVGGDLRLPEVLRERATEPDQLAPIGDCPFVPQSTDERLVAVRFPDGDAIRPFMLDRFDTHGTYYAPPPELLDSADLSLVPDIELERIARQEIYRCYLPTNFRVIDAIRRTLENERLATHGPWLTGAFKESQRLPKGLPKSA